MTKLSDAQAIILSRAAQHPDGVATPPASLPPAPRGAVAKALLRAGLLEVIDSTERQHPGLAWKLDGEAVFLRITAAGLRAIGVQAETAEVAVPDAPGATLTAPDAPDGHNATAGDGAAQEAVVATQDSSTTGEAPTLPVQPPGESLVASGATPVAPDSGETPKAAQRPSSDSHGAFHAKPTLRDVARAVLAAWDGNDGVRLAAALAELRAALPRPRPPRQPGAPRSPRQGTKQEMVLTLLRRPEGASGPDIIAATGWAPHTVRGFLAGLKKRGTAVLVHERVRQVGSGKEGAKGSYTVYRIAAEPAD